ncbi:xylan 1,4-beta-xylosidase [Parabacteroides sp. PFB2-10]|uniref:GH39 family glycosyl hydrolase n=1 Tax=Parabacteroides sp. PFB2-10 TaxID=1742405 RepID=UPI002472F9B2|nr:beta-xylosidase [Parabacteroides sp. PFB2-10]MDH6313664.1 xylan 1,4-beta-xylosidase [Parabacteroides sp. PFB2-10]MDL2244561.1 beta-xylosidase [Parabacteroides sp. OttesenSCG-928-J18]
MEKLKTTFVKSLFIVSILFSASFYSAAQSVAIEVDLQERIEPMRPIWAWFGYDEPNYTYMKDGKKLLTELAELSYTPVFVRAHNLLTTGDGTAALKWGSTNAYTEDSQGNPVYNWTIIDSIFDTYLARGMKPLVEIGFMPEALSVNPQPYQHDWHPSRTYNNIFTGWTHPPKDYNKWRELVYQWVKHTVEKYGEEEVASWYWEVWNEPDIGYWQGSFEEYCMLYDYAADGLKKAFPRARIGGPHTTDPSNQKASEYLRKFLEHCLRGKNYATGKTGSPLDYIGFHAKGSPRVVEGKVRMNIGRQLLNVASGFEIVASFPELKHLPIIIGESDPEGCAACSIDFHPQNAYRNGTMYSSYTAAAFARKYELARKYGVNFLGAVSWSFEFEDQAWFAGFRDLATNGVDKPVLNVFRMFGMMKGDLVAVKSSAPLSAEEMTQKSVREMPDVNALASVDEHSAAVMVWNYHDDDIKAAAAHIQLDIKGLKGKNVRVNHYRIDDKFSNSYEAWKAMGEPQNPTPEQYALLERSGQLQMCSSPEWRNVSGGGIDVVFDLPRQGVSLITLSW